MIFLIYYHLVFFKFVYKKNLSQSLKDKIKLNMEPIIGQLYSKDDGQQFFCTERLQDYVETKYFNGPHIMSIDFVPPPPTKIVHRRFLLVNIFNYDKLIIEDRLSNKYSVVVNNITEFKEFKEKYNKHCNKKDNEDKIRILTNEIKEHDRRIEQAQRDIELYTKFKNERLEKIKELEFLV
jgi:hypothetical protein